MEIQGQCRNSSLGSSRGCSTGFWTLFPPLWTLHYFGVYWGNTVDQHNSAPSLLVESIGFSNSAQSFTCCPLVAELVSAILGNQIKNLFSTHTFEFLICSLKQTNIKWATSHELTLIKYFCIHLLPSIHFLSLLTFLICYLASHITLS